MRISLRAAESKIKALGKDNEVCRFHAVSDVEVTLCVCVYI